MADFTHPPLFEAPTWGTPSEFLDETYPRKTRGMGLLYGENCVILQPFLTDPYVWQRDGIAMVYTRYSIYAVARKKPETVLTYASHLSGGCEDCQNCSVLCCTHDTHICIRQQLLNRGLCFFFVCSFYVSHFVCSLWVNLGILCSSILLYSFCFVTRQYQTRDLWGRTSSKYLLSVEWDVRTLLQSVNQSNNQQCFTAFIPRLSSLSFLFQPLPSITNRVPQQAGRTSHTDRPILERVIIYSAAICWTVERWQSQFI